MTEGITIPNPNSEAKIFIACNPGPVSDGYHTFDELYEHRHMLFLAFMKLYGGWKSRAHADGSVLEGWFIAGMLLDFDLDFNDNSQISYHLPIRLWDLCPGDELECAFEWDGHSSDDVLDRLKRWISTDIK